MKQQINKTISFNGKVLLFLVKNGNYWIAIKPICEALGIEYTRAFKSLKSDIILSQLLAKQPMVGIKAALIYNDKTLIDNQLKFLFPV